MPPSPPSSGSPERPIPWRIIISGLMGSVAVLAFAISGQIDAQVAAWTILAVAGAAGLLAWDAIESAPVGRSQDREPAPPHEAAPPYASLVEALPDPVLVIAAHEPDDLTGRRFVLVNAAAREMLRLHYDAGLLVTVIREPAVLEAVDEALFGGVTAEAVYQSGGAQERIWRASAKPLGRAPDGEHLALLVLRDETDARRSERMRADFLANASHELRTPLASLTGFIETLQGPARDDPAVQQKFLGIMYTQADRMRRLVDDLLSLSRIELNEHIAPDGEVDLRSAVRDVADSVSPMARERKVRVELDISDQSYAPVVGDRDQIVQVVQNLVDNGLKYAPDGSTVRVSVEFGVTQEGATSQSRAASHRLNLLTPDHGPELYGVVRVTDEGRGLAREHLPRLTERFYRVEGQKSGERQGTGLGLAIVKHIVNRHRGGLAVESAPGDGATFTAYFPQIPAVSRPSMSGGSATVMKVS